MVVLIAMNETSGDEKNPFALVGVIELKEVRSCLGFSRQSRGIVDDDK